MCRPYGFGRHADMTETPLRSVTNRGIWIPMLAPTCSTMISSDEPRCRGFNQSVCNSLCQSVCYLPEIRSSVSQYLVQYRYRQVSLLVPQCMIPWSNTLITLSSLWWCITEWAQWYLSVIRSDKSQSRSVSTQQTLSEIPVVYLYSHPVTLWRLVHPKHFYGIRELHDVMV